MYFRKDEMDGHFHLHRRSLKEHVVIVVEKHISPLGMIQYIVSPASLYSVQTVCFSCFTELAPII